MIECKFCQKKYKNTHGLHIHQFYCRVKIFTNLPIVNCDHDKYQELLNDSYFISDSHYWPKEIFRFMKKDEVGMYKGKRYVLKITP